MVLKDPKDIEILLNNRNSLVKDDIYKIIMPPFGEGLVSTTNGNINKSVNTTAHIAY